MIDEDNIYIRNRVDFSAGMAWILRRADETIDAIREDDDVAAAYVALGEKYPNGGPVTQRMDNKKRDLVIAHLQIQAKRATAESQSVIEDVINQIGNEVSKYV